MVFVLSYFFGKPFLCLSAYYNEILMNFLIALEIFYCELHKANKNDLYIINKYRRFLLAYDSHSIFCQIFVISNRKAQINNGFLKSL